MRVPGSYWKLCVVWAVIALPTLYYGLPYGGWHLSIDIESLADAIGLLIACGIMLLPIVSLPFFLRSAEKETEHLDD